MVKKQKRKNETKNTKHKSGYPFATLDNTELL